MGKDERRSPTSTMVRDDPKYKEDLLFTDEVIEEIERVHGFSLASVTYHYTIPHVPRSIEVDVFCIFHTPSGRERIVGFELKESDYLKALRQAEVRRSYFDYFYIVLNREPWALPPDYFCELGRMGIGLFCKNRMVVKAKWLRNGGFVLQSILKI